MRGLIALAVAVLALLAAPARAEALFDDYSVLSLTLQAPLAPVTRFGSNERVVGTLSVDGAAADSNQVTVSPRGITRRKRGVCQFPPLRLDFAGAPPQTSLFHEQKSLFVTTHCRPAESFQQYLVLEYLAYRLYNVLTPIGIRPRLARISYVEPGGARPPTVRLALFTEGTEFTARRNKLEQLTTGNIPVARLSARDAGRFAAFQYLIGNLDWSMRTSADGVNCCHNARLLGASATAASELIPVPYDFDFAGLVDAPYATPPQIVSIKNVRQRYYRGYCRHNDSARAGFAEAWARRDALRSLIANEALLEDRARSKALTYLDGFFAATAAPAGVERVLRTCLPN